MTKGYQNLRNRIRQLRKEINEIEDARAFKFRLPESWIIEEEKEDE